MITRLVLNAGWKAGKSQEESAKVTGMPAALPSKRNHLGSRSAAIVGSSIPANPEIGSCKL